MKATMLIPTFKRNELLEIGLQSIRKYSDIDILILDEFGDAEEISKKFKTRYLLTKDSDCWRMPGFAFNIGAHNTDAEIIILSCPEIYHVDDCLNPMIKVVENDPMALASPHGKDDRRNTFLKNKKSRLHTLIMRMPFLMALRRNLFMEMHGYDEDYLGAALDDNDFIDRLEYHGCELKMVEANCIHIFHERKVHRGGGLHAINRKIYKSKNKQPKNFVRNKDRDWGVAYA